MQPFIVGYELRMKHERTNSYGYTDPNIQT